jgi:hypothetical protein
MAWISTATHNDFIEADQAARAAMKAVFEAVRGVTEERREELKTILEEERAHGRSAEQALEAAAQKIPWLHTMWHSVPSEIRGAAVGVVLTALVEHTPLGKETPNVTNNYITNNVTVVESCEPAPAQPPKEIYP